MLCAQVLTPASAVDKLKNACHSAGAALHVVSPDAMGQADRSGSQRGSQRGSSSSSSSFGTQGHGDKLLHAAHSSSSSSSSSSGASVSSPSAGVLIIYTSGTTGRPKGALHTHG
jgi:malonyl-CoA/methylmalonyl-CoA synthetase